MDQRDDHANDGALPEDTATGTLTTRYGGEDDRPPASSVIATVADATGTDPERLRPLYEVVDPDALNRMFGHGTGHYRRSSGRAVTFDFEGCSVTVHDDGRTVVAPPETDQR